MADYENKYLDAAGVKYLWDKAEEIYLKKKDLEEIKDSTVQSISNLELDIITGNASTTEALTTLLANGGEVALGSDILIEAPISITKDTVLDLVGHTLKTLSEDNVFIVSGASLVIKNGHGSVAIENCAFADND